MNQMQYDYHAKNGEMITRQELDYEENGLVVWSKNEVGFSVNSWVKDKYINFR